MITLDKIDKVNRATDSIFKVPQNYFENLTLSILNKTTESTIILQTKIQKPFSIPDSYFEGLSATIMGRIAKIEKKNIDLESLERVNVFNVPESYFKALEINTKIERIGKNNIFKVPKDYFESLGSLACDRNCPDEIILLWQQEIENLENFAIGKVFFLLTFYVLFPFIFTPITFP